MKTDIFKDLMPLLNMTFGQIDNLAIQIVEENEDYWRELRNLACKIDHLVNTIIKKQNERI